jgi:import inner membrane translocase subunit TIM9
MEAVQSLPPHQQKQFMEKLEQMQMKDSLTMYTTLVHRCFDECVFSFRSKTMDKKEGSCVENCASRYVKATQRVGLRFAEHQAMTQKRHAAQGGGAGAIGG